LSKRTQTIVLENGLQVYEFRELSPELLYKILELREAIFAIEQNCLYQDLDGLDQDALHLVKLADSEQTLIAYCRIITKTAANKISRVIIAREFRKQKLGYALVKQAKEICLQLSDGPIEIEAQSHLHKFYEGLGFTINSEAYQLDGTPHYKMLYVAPKTN
jgi:ElaA protein